MQRIAFAAVILLGCGSDASVGPDALPVDAPIDAPDRFVGMWDDPHDLPRANCRPGAMAGFARRDVWLDLGLRTAVEGGALATYVPTWLDDERVPHLLTDDDLFIRRVTPRFDGDHNLEAFTVCDVLEDGTIRGASVLCFADRCLPPRPFEEAPFGRIAGEAEGDGLTRLGEVALEGPAVNVRVARGVAFVAMRDRGLRTIAIADGVPRLLGWYEPHANDFNDVKLMTVGGRHYAIMAGYPSEVVDVTDPARPLPVAQLTALGAHTLSAEGTWVALVDGVRARLAVYDLADPHRPLHRGTAEVEGLVDGFHDVHLHGGLAYASAPYHGLVVFDARVAVPIELGRTVEDGSRYWHSPWRTDVAGQPIILNGDEFATPDNGLRLLDGDRGSPTFLGTVGEWHLRGETSMHNVMAIGDRVYLAHYQDGIRVLDISTPSAPRQIGYYNTWTPEHARASGLSGAFGLDVDPVTRRIYVADSTRGLLVLGASAALFP